MAEKCPLLVGRQYRDTEEENFSIPGVCLEQCEPVWHDALNSGEEVFDDFKLMHSSSRSAEGIACSHVVEHAGETLQRIGNAKSAKRGYGVISACEITGEEAFAMDVTFTCPNN